jgi:Ribbon-helix-helix protein, copG family
MPQINVTVDDLVAGAVDRIAAAKRVSRTDLMRQTLMEMIEAESAGRLAFAREEGPKLDTSLSTLAQQLREAVVELDRSQRENQKLTKRVLDAWNGGEEAARDAHARLSEHINSKFRDGYDPFRERADEVLALMKNLPEQLVIGLGSHLGEIEKRLAESHTLAAQPRTANYLYVSSNKRIVLGLLVATHLVFLTFGFLSSAYIMDTGQQATANAQLLAAPTPTSACRLVNRLFASKDCKVPESARKQAVAAIAAEERP